MRKLKTVTVTHEIIHEPSNITFFVLFSFKFQSWYVRAADAIVYSYWEGNDSTATNLNRAKEILLEYFKLANIKP